MKISKIFLPLFFITFLACNGGSKNQNRESNEEVKKENSAEALAEKNCLKTTKTLETNTLSHGDLNKVFKEETFEEKIQQGFPEVDGAVSIPISSAASLRVGNKTFPHQNSNSFMASKEMIASIKEGLTLKANENAITIHQALNILDPRWYGAQLRIC